MLETVGEITLDVNHDGERIRKLLSATGKTPADLARAAGVTRTAVDRYLKAERIGKLAWLTVRVGLTKIGIDPRKVRPDDQAAEEEIDLRPLIHGFDRDELERIKKILEADTLDREKLLYFVDGLLLTAQAKR